MSELKRRGFLKATAGVAAGAALGAGSGLWVPDANAQAYKVVPEKGAKLRVLRWKRFVQGDEDMWAENTKKFTALTGVEVRVDAEGWEDVRPKAAVAANIGSGPDIIIGTMEDAHQYPEKLLDVTDARQLSRQQVRRLVRLGEGVRHAGKKWVAIMMGAAGNAIVYRDSHVKAAGFDSVPSDMAGFLKLCQALKAKEHAGGFALGNATGDSSVDALAALGARRQARRREEQRRDQQPRDDRRARVREAALRDVHPGTLSWLDPNNNKAFLDGQLSLTANGISIYYAAKTSTDEKLLELAKDIQHAQFPIGVTGQARELDLVFPMMTFKYTKYPNAAREYLRFMMEREQYEPWQQASIGYVCQPLAAYEKNPIWTSDPKITPYRDGMKITTPGGYAGKLGYASAACIADFIVPNMVAEAASGSKTPKEAAERAQKRAERYYKV
jgi:multiple sugar transport system substrate-binding protein